LSAVLVYGDRRVVVEPLEIVELLLPSGRLIKADAVDHCRGHDLVGCQDPGWDLAGAAVELSLDAGERRELLRRFTAHARPPVARSWNERANRSTGLQPVPGLRQGECRIIRAGAGRSA